MNKYAEYNNQIISSVFKVNHQTYIMKKLFKTLAISVALFVGISSAQAQRLFDALPEKATFLPQVVEHIYT
jgi:hypothetical protein